MLGDAINRIVKFYHKSLNEKISYAHLMCGQLGLVHALLYIFSYGYANLICNILFSLVNLEHQKLVIWSSP